MSGATRLGRAFVTLLIITTAFPIVASLLPPENVPQALGVADVAVAAVYAGLAFWVESRGRSLVTDSERALAFRIVQLGSVVIVGLLALFFIAPSGINWNVLLIGLGWRSWLVIWVLPSLLALRRQRGAGQG